MTPIWLIHDYINVIKPMKMTLNSKHRKEEKTENKECRKTSFPKER